MYIPMCKNIYNIVDLSSIRLSHSKPLISNYNSLLFFHTCCEWFVSRAETKDCFSVPDWKKQIKSFLNPIANYVQIKPSICPRCLGIHIIVHSIFVKYILCKDDIINYLDAVSQFATKSNSTPCIWLDPHCQPIAIHLYHISGSSYKNHTLEGHCNTVKCNHEKDMVGTVWT